MKRKLPKLKSDREAERFLEESDLTNYDLSGFALARFEFDAKTERVNMRLPKALLEAVKLRAAKARMPYQKFIRAVLEKEISAQSRK